MKKHLHLFSKKYTFVVTACLTSIIAIINSSFIQLPANSSGACTGTFATTNQLGSNFAILSPGTGAPGTGTCASCHQTYVNNSGTGVLTISVGGGITQYVPGQTYTVQVSLTQASIIAMDFEVTTRDQSSGTVALGNFIITDALRTRLSNGNFGGAGTTYVEGTACGVDVISTGFNQWSFDWKAPTTAVGNVTFYLAAVAANFNNQNTFDYTYSKTIVLSAVSGINDPSVISDFKLFPNPVSEYFTMDYTLKKESKVQIRIMSMEGKEVDLLLQGTQKQGQQHHTFNISNKKYATGLYNVQMNVDNTISNYKLFIQ